MATHWTKRELKILREGFRTGRSDKEIGSDLKRSALGVVYKRNSMGLHRRGTPKRKQAGSGRTGTRATKWIRAAHKEERAAAERAPQTPYSVIIRGPNRELSMQVDRETGQAILQIMLGVI
jgi:hypothetical protein